VVWIWLLWPIGVGLADLVADLEAVAVVWVWLRRWCGFGGGDGVVLEVALLLIGGIGGEGGVNLVVDLPLAQREKKKSI
jgi:hypothetical protein